ncbi:MAG: T9SS type A sorting domain-containing protein, partial [Balneolales bacterium]|nr:T9SS type A sorting domain-containing protein [Balneolales bacterium]
VTPGEPVLVSFWVKYDNVTYPDSIGKGDNNIGMTALWYNNLEGGAAGWGEIGGLDIRLNGDYNPNVIPLAERVEESGWTQYAFVVYPADDAVGMELRLRYWHAFEGVTYWDDVSITNISEVVMGTFITEDFTTDDHPKGIHLLQNYPNPFNPSTKISFRLDNAETVNLNVFNILGQRVATVISNTRMSSGLHTFEFDARNLPSGIYIYQLSTESFTELRRMTLIK